MNEVTGETFDDEVLRSEIPTVVDFWGPQCAPCLVLMPQVEALEREHDGKVRVLKVEAPRNRRLCLRLQVLSLPTILLYKNGQEMDRLAGEVTIGAIRDSIEKVLKTD
jgi:thioredoxin 1